MQSINEPNYFICARRDNGFIAAYRAYYLITGAKIRRISKFQYEYSVIFGKMANDYEKISPGYYVFNIQAKNSNPSEWKIEQSKYQTERYDIDALVMLLGKAEITLKGYIQLVLNVLDEYQLVHMSRTDQEGHGVLLGEQSLLFRDGNLVKIGRKIVFGDVRDFYRERQKRNGSTV